MKVRHFAILLGFLALSQATLLAGSSSPDPKGRPKKFEQGKKSYGLWFEDGVWHLRMTSTDRTVFAGSVRVTGDRIIGEIQALEKAKKPKNADWIVPHKDGAGFDFRFVTTGATDGVAFKAGPRASNIQFRLNTGGDDDPRRILIGSKGDHPDKATFTLPAHP